MRLFMGILILGCISHGDVLIQDQSRTKKCAYTYKFSKEKIVHRENEGSQRRSQKTGGGGVLSLFCTNPLAQTGVVIFGINQV